MSFSRIKKHYKKHYRLFVDFLFDFIKNKSFTYILKDDKVFHLNLLTNDYEELEFELYNGIIYSFFQKYGLKIFPTNKTTVEKGFEVLENQRQSKKVDFED
jgi:hypothetical protein